MTYGIFRKSNIELLDTPLNDQGEERGFRMKTKHPDFYIGIVLFFVSLLIICFALGISGEAKIVPTSLGIAMLAFSAVIARNGITASEKKDDKPETLSGPFRGTKTALTFTLLTFAYFVAFEVIGYWIATLVFMVVFQWYMGVRSAKQIILVTAVYLIASFVLFVVILQLPIYKVGLTGPLFRFIR